MALIKKRNSYHSQSRVHEGLHTNQFLFCKRMLSKIRIFFALNVSLSENKIDKAYL